MLLQELANAQTLPDSTISAHSMPLLHGLSAVHSCVNVFTHICKVGQVRILIQLPYFFLCKYIVNEVAFPPGLFSLFCVVSLVGIHEGCAHEGD